MSTQAERIVRIEHPDTGRRYAVSEHAFKHTKVSNLGDQTYQDAGYKIVSYEDGREYSEGVEPTEYAINVNARNPEIGAVAEEEPKKAAATATATVAATSTAAPTMSGSARRAASFGPEDSAAPPVSTE